MIKNGMLSKILVVAIPLLLPLFVFFCWQGMQNNRMEQDGTGKKPVPWVWLMLAGLVGLAVTLGYVAGADVRF